MEKQGFTCTLPNDETSAFRLPKAVYITSVDDTTVNNIYNKAIHAIKKGLFPYYGSGWVNKFTIFATGSGPIMTANLELQKIVNSQHDETEEISSPEEDEGGES